VDELTPTAPTDFYIRANDDTGNTATWGDWGKIMLSPTIGGPAANQVLYNNSTNTMAGSSNLTFDGTNLSVGGAIKPSAGGTSANGIQFPSDPGGGGGDTAWIRYYAHSGERTNLEIGVANDAGASVQDSINLVVPAGSGVGINRQQPTATLDVNGTILASGDITAFSDATLKTNVQTISNPLGTMRNLRGVYFDRIDTGEAGSGVIAQETQPHMPMLIKNNNGILSVNYNGFSGLFIESIKALEDQVNELKAEVARLKGL
jgi:hypothetical protein